MSSGFIVHNYVLGLTVWHICHSDMDYCVHPRQAAEGRAKVWPAS